MGDNDQVTNADNQQSQQSQQSTDGTGTGGQQGGQNGQNSTNANQQQQTDNAATLLGGQQQPPITYEKFNVPDGSEPINEATHNELVTLGNELKLNQQQLQKIVDYGAKKIGDGMEAVRLKAIAMQEEWRKKSMTDPEISAGMEHAQRLVARFGNENFKSMMNETGVGNHPEFIKFCIQAGRLLGEAPFVDSGKPASPPQTSILGALAKQYDGKM